MVLNKEIYDFSRRHVVEINDLMFVDKPCLLALKSYAYFENRKLYKEGKVNSDSYLKHSRDILRILGAFSPEEMKPIADLPSTLKESLTDIVPILTSNKRQLKDYGFDRDFVLNAINAFLGVL